VPYGIRYEKDLYGNKYDEPGEIVLRNFIRFKKNGN
jgi:hypothetical protein